MANVFSMFMISLMLPVMGLIAPFAVALSIIDVLSSKEWWRKLLAGLVGIFFGYIMFVAFRHYVIFNTTDLVVKIISIAHPILVFLGVFLYYVLENSDEEEEIETEKSSLNS